MAYCRRPRRSRRSNANGPVNENLRSLLAGTAGPSVAAVTTVLLTILAKPKAGDLAGRERTVRLFLIGLAAQCPHFMEEFVARFEDRFPARPQNFFVVFNLMWLCVWILSAIGLQRGYRFALFPGWFFAIAGIVNGIAHPIFAIVARGYFPGLITSPVVGAMEGLLWLSLQALTAPPA